MEQGKKVKSALVIQGGGTRGIYAAGVLDAFLLNKISFPYIIGTSAGSLCGANYLSKDFGRSKYVVTELMSDPKFVSVRNRIFKGTIFDFDFLFHEVPKSILPFNEKEFFNSPSLFYMVATDMNSGKTIYFEKNAISDPYKGLAASSSLPLLSKPVNVDGYLCLDGGVAMSVPFRKPLEEEIEKIDQRTHKSPISVIFGEIQHKLLLLGSSNRYALRTDINHISFYRFDILQIDQITVAAS
ncbi:MAG TPA: hypothetical protein DEF61_01900 [Firmicutes bacterium]|nr:hypothetical protein [Bacillota bacterium]